MMDFTEARRVSQYLRSIRVLHWLDIEFYPTLWCTVLLEIDDDANRSVKIVLRLGPNLADGKNQFFVLWKKTKRLK